MLCTHDTAWQETWKPRSFTGLMSVYDSNYIGLNRLLGQAVPAQGAVLVSNRADDLPLQLDCIERCRYTTTLKLTYWFEEGGMRVPDPDLLVRIYHDARMAEAMQCRHNRRHPLLRRFATGHGGELQRRWNINLMLNKWLDYCLERGHGFAS